MMLCDVDSAVYSQSGLNEALLIMLSLAEHLIMVQCHKLHPDDDVQ